jgi:hypothetical protein
MPKRERSTKTAEVAEPPRFEYFLALPAEIRVMIYNYVLQWPRDTLRPGDAWSDFTLVLGASSIETKHGQRAN